MKKFLTQGRLATLIVVAVLVIDQLIKISVKTNMALHQNIHITDWFYIYFTENNGMAFGMEFLPKIFLTLFRIVAVGLITWYLHKVTTHSEKFKTGYVVCLAFILAGAIGNIIDCVFYGEIFSQSTASSIAQFVPVGICSIFPLSIHSGPTGCLYGADSVSSSLAPSLILPMPPLVAVSSHCCCSIAAI